ncbi:MAG: apolipoprotein N-acyltransferase [Rhodospirillales bacterium]|nr:apolipoprotein N-acyltransferase [Rhodospirillales bacterium]
MKYGYVLAALSFVAGIVAHFSMAPYNFPPALFVSFPTLYYVLKHTETNRLKFLFTWLFSFGYFVTSLSWISNALLVPGNEAFYWAYPLAIGGLPATLALFPAICVTFVTRKFDLEHVSGWLAFVFAFSLSEVARGFLFTGFPWNNVGYTWISVLPIAQVTAFGGIYFLSVLTIFWASLPALFLLHRREKAFVFMMMLGVLSLSGSALWGWNRMHRMPTPPPSPVMVHVIQPNIRQDLKWHPDKMQSNFETLISLTQDVLDRNKTAMNLVVWPETATVNNVLYAPENATRLRALFPATQKNYLLTGILRAQKDKGKLAYFNSFNIFGPGLQLIGMYDKHHLVPFGEYIPFQEHIPLEPVANFSGLTAGTGPQKLHITDAISVSPQICYEIIFPGAAIADARLLPNLIVNVTNDGWYGDSSGPRQHLVQTQVRAIETGIPVARAANTGISAIITPDGHISGQASYGEQGAVSISLPFSLQNGTIFAKLKHKFAIGLLFVLLCSAYISRRIR